MLRAPVDPVSVASLPGAPTAADRSRVAAVHRDTAPTGRPETGTAVDAGSAAMLLHRAGFLERRRERHGRYLGPSQLRDLAGPAARDRIREMRTWAGSGCEDGAALWVDGQRREPRSGSPLVADGVILAVEAYAERSTTPREYRGDSCCGALLLWTAETR